MRPNCWVYAPRTFRRTINRYKEDGLDGLIDKRLAQVSHRRAPVDEVMRLVDRNRHRSLFCSLYTDRGSHYRHTPEAGGKVDKANPTPFGRAMAQLGIERIAAYSPEARGRSERAFRTHQDRLVRELEVAGITDRADASCGHRCAAKTRFVTSRFTCNNTTLLTCESASIYTCYNTAH